VLNRILSLVLLTSGISACAHHGDFIWADDLAPEALMVQPYRILALDRVAVSVWNQPKLSADVQVRPDGNATLPLLGDVALAGLTPGDAATEVERLLDGLVVEPQVTVTVASPQPASVSVLGEVRTPGMYTVRPGEGVLHALAKAGGLSQFAQANAVFVLRKDPRPMRVRFDYATLRRGSGLGALFQLRDGDVVVVE
jgi:polysaccharide biosynthesis/export protein